MRAAILQTIRDFPGGWEAMAGALGMSRDALENRIYERRGQGLLLSTAVMMAKLADSPALAHELARQAGGVYVALPPAATERGDILGQFNALYVELGNLSAEFRAAVGDDEIDDVERARLVRVGQQVHAKIEQLLGLSFAVYCRPSSDEGEP